MLKSQIHFVFQVRERPWNVLGGQNPPGTVFVVMSLPGRAVAGGLTAEEAIRNLQDLIDAKIELAGGDALGWWTAGRDRMTKDEQEVFRQVVGDAALHAMAPLHSGRPKGYSYFTATDDCSLQAS